MAKRKFGHIRRHADGRWVLAVPLPSRETGKRERLWIYGATRREVEIKLDRFREEGRPTHESRHKTKTVGDLLDAYLAAKALSMRAHSHEMLTFDVERDLRPHLGPPCSPASAPIA